jgi:SAM-dependent methyltransferase
MIESNNPEIDVNQLMERIHAEVARRRDLGLLQRNGSGHAVSTVLPQVHFLASLPPMVSPRHIDVKEERLTSILQRAREKTEVSKRIPKLLRRLFRKQGGYNKLLLESVAVLTRTNVELNKRLQELAGAFEMQNRWLSDLSSARDADAAWMRAAATIIASVPQHRESVLASTNALAEQINTLEQRNAATDEQLDGLRAQSAHMAEHLRNAQSELDGMTGLRSEFDRAGEHLRNLQSEADRFAEQASRIQAQQDQFGTRADDLGRHLNNLQTQIDNQNRHLNNLQTQADAVRDQAAIYQAELNHVKSDSNDAKQLALRADERQSSDGAYLKSELHLLNRRLLELASTSGEGATSSVKNTPLPIDKHEFDALYVAFENQFRGSREAIKKRVRVYLDDVRGAGAVTADSPILDLGCGRGEWLELVNENGLAGEGVDSNAIMVSACQERGLRVTEGDALEYLRALPAESQGAITAFHLIEHLQFQVLVQLLRESFRVLRPGGLAIFETPNPDNVLVGSNRFYSDPTHLHPLPKEYSRFMLQSVGFSDVVARPLNPDKDSLPKNAASPELRNFLNRLFFGEQDYAVIGKKQ